MTKIFLKNQSKRKVKLSILFFNSICLETNEEKKRGTHIQIITTDPIKQENHQVENIENRPKSQSLSPVAKLKKAGEKMSIFLIDLVFFTIK